MTEKKCSKCQTVKSLEDDFSKDKAALDGRDSQCKECRHQYYVVNAERKIKRQLELVKAYSPEQKAKIKENNAKWRQSDRYKQWKLAYDRKRMKDPLFRLGVNLRGNMYHALKAMKGFRKWEDLVGYTLSDLAAHIESQFTPGISWDNYGTVWHIDHIVPKSWFKYASTDDPTFKECWALSNLQPKLGIDNRRKGNRFAG